MKKIFTTHNLIVSLAILVIFGGSIYLAAVLKRQPRLTFVPVKTGEIVQAVQADGAVKAAQDLVLSFQRSGNVAQVPVNAGDQVKQGQTLMALDLKDVSAGIGQAQAALAIAQANYQKVLNGATSADIDVAKAAVLVAQTSADNAQKTLDETTQQQNLLISNAFASFLNTTNPTLLSNGLSAMPAATNVGSATVSISGNYTDTQQGHYVLTIFNTGIGLRFKVSGLENTEIDARATPVALGNLGLFVQISGTAYPNDSWTINIPNTQSPAYLTDYNVYNTALQTRGQAILNAQNQLNSAQAAQQQAQAALELKQTAARPEDIATAKAQEDGAAATLQAAQNNYANSIITAPIDGIITSVDAKIGETASPGKEVIKMISSKKFEIESFLSENDVGKIKTGDQANVTLNAYGSAMVFPATVITIDPAATVQNGISTYKTTLEFTQADDRIKAGMNGNVIITDQKRDNTLLVPATALIRKNNQTFVLLNKNGQPQETLVQTGITDLNGNVEITSGLNVSDQIAAFGNQ